MEQSLSTTEYIMIGVMVLIGILGLVILASSILLGKKRRKKK